LQNIPSELVKAGKYAKAFIPRNSDYILLSCDYSQIELRLIAELSKDANMVDAFQKGLDIHTATAAKVYNVPIDEVTQINVAMPRRSTSYYLWCRFSQL
jgi:DNA polymerase-1